MFSFSYLNLRLSSLRTTSCHQDYVRGINTLPVEIADHICHEADIEDIPSLRLQNRFWRDVATPYLLTKAYVQFRRDHFDRLAKISDHPVMSQYVYEVEYEPNMLEEKTRASWEEDVPKKPRNIHDNFPNSPSRDASARELRLYERELTRWAKEERNRSHNRTAAELNMAWDIYQRYLSEQRALENNNFATDELTKAIGQFPKLKTVSMDCEFMFGEGKRNPKRDAYEDAFASALRCAGQDCPGVGQMRGLMQAIHNATVELDSLQIGGVSWKFMGQEDHIIEMMKEVLAPLKHFELGITTGYDEEADEIGSEILICRTAFRDGRLGNFIAAATKLETLLVDFEWYEPCCPINFEHLVLFTHWPALRTLDLKCIEISRTKWLDFLRQHSATLRRLHLAHISLSTGLWVEVLEDMQEALQLEEMWFRWELRAMYPRQEWNLDSSLDANEDDAWCSNNRTRWALEKYMVEGGTCPLRDEQAHPQTW